MSCSSAAGATCWPQMSDRPLAGRRIVVTRAGAQADEPAAELRALGGEPLISPAIAYASPLDIAPLDEALKRLGTYTWLIFTSAQAVRVLFERLDSLGLDTGTIAEVRVGAIGPATARELSR